MLKSDMTLEKLRGMYKSINVTFKNDHTLRRAIFYYSFVQWTYDSLVVGDAKKELSKRKGEYEKVAPAFTRQNFLAGLCQILDRYIIDAINEELKKNNSEYVAYFEGIFQKYPESVNTFRKSYEKIERALTRIAELFQQNILTACKRVLNDWGSIQSAFVDQTGGFLDKLVGIQSTGSDFHKGGLQVLILTFSTQKPEGTVRVVYKPSDVEVDCLIIGDTKTVEMLRPGFQQASLMEMLNTLMKDPSVPGLYAFPTYKVLPIYPGSQLVPDKDGRLPIRNSYGYIQFLEYGGTIKQPGEEKAICTRYYTLLGQLAAVAAAFSLSDLHMQNLIVHNYTPYLIDLENALCRVINEFADTEMIGEGAIDSGAINGVVTKMDYNPQVDHSPGKKTYSEIELVDRYSIEKNRLWDASGKLVSNETYLDQIIAGFMGTMKLINIHLKEFNSWFERLRKGGVVRIVPKGSDKFQSAITFAYSPKNKKEVNVAVVENLQGFLETTYAEWEKSPETTPPRFLCFQIEHALGDIINIDVPVFYHQLNTSDLLDSWGQICTVPDSILVQNVAKPVKALLKRGTYFLHPPLEDVQQVQLAVNTAPQKANVLLKQLEDSIKRGADVRQYKVLVEMDQVDKE